MDDISVKINDDANKIEIDVDKIDVDKIDFDKIEVDKNDVDKNDDEIFTFDNELHNGNPITRIEISPNEKYLITFSSEDGSIVGWDVEDIDKVQLKFHQTVKIDRFIRGLCVSDEKFISNGINVHNKGKTIALTFSCFYEHDTFGEHKIIWIYSTQTKNNKWECKRFYEIPEIPEDYELISISKYDKVYLFSNDCIYEWDINTEKSVKIFGNNKDKNKFKTENIGIFSNEKFIFLKINYKIIVYSNELGIPIASLDINNDIQLHKFMNHTGLFLLPSLFYYTPDKEIKYCWNSKYKNMFNQTLFDESTNEQTKFVFGIQNGHVWKSKLDEKMSKMNFSSENSDELNKKNNKIIECDEYLNVHSFNLLYMDAVSTLFQKATTNGGSAEYPKTFKKLTESTENLIKWDIRIGNDKIELKVFNKNNTEWNLISTRIEDYYYPHKNRDYDQHELIASSLFNNNDIVILTTFGILFYTFNENNNSISLNYFYFMKSDGYGNISTKNFKVTKEYFQNLPYHYQIMIVLE
ncbi:hypothetical protein RhiirA4_531362 [Rhizophagus irregularis]|uniref:Uncharacterized protein n=1 Tax=Rhizophagus irregularis TaxID=588596 RepID=A0A2I1G0W0_9GLOM|nr:hypothetical protein RhiirA4_531362 [Rhizophagus irregularis]